MDRHLPTRDVIATGLVAVAGLVYLLWAIGSAFSSWSKPGTTALAEAANPMLARTGRPSQQVISRHSTRHRPVASTPLGWALGIGLAFLSGEGEARGIGPVTVGILGVLLFAAVPAAAVVLAVRAARAGYRSGRIVVAVSGSLLVVTLFLTLLLGRIGLVVTALAAVLVLAGVRSRNKPSPPGPDGVRRQGGPPVYRSKMSRPV